jgi:predicted kinase
MFQTDEGETSGYGLGRYTQRGTDAVYTQLLERAESLLSEGESVILDASWIDARWREAAAAVASRTSSDLVELCCQARPQVAERRIMRRLHAGLDLSEATPDVRHSMSEAMDQWSSCVVVDTSDEKAEVSIARVLEVLDPRRRQEDDA